MMDLDGARDSKPVLERKYEHTSIRQSDHKPTKLRRFMSIGSRSKGDPIPSKYYSTTEIDNTLPLQNLSPRSLESGSSAKKQTKRSISTFLLSRTSTNASGPAKGGDYVYTVRGHMPVTETSSTFPGTLEAPAHLHLTGNLYQAIQMQSKKGSATKSFYDMPTAASRAAALGSHPVGQEDLESEAEYETPMEFEGARRENMKT